jgi:hypothetical protein
MELKALHRHGWTLSAPAPVYGAARTLASGRRFPLRAGGEALTPNVCTAGIDNRQAAVGSTFVRHVRSAGSNVCGVARTVPGRLEGGSLHHVARCRNNSSNSAGIKSGRSRSAFVTT